MSEMKSVASGERKWRRDRDRILDSEGNIVCLVCDGDGIVYWTDLETKTGISNADLIVQTPTIKQERDALREAVDGVAAHLRGLDDCEPALPDNWESLADHEHVVVELSISTIRALMSALALTLTTGGGE